MVALLKERTKIEKLQFSPPDQPMLRFSLGSDDLYVSLKENQQPYSSLHCIVAVRSGLFNLVLWTRVTKAFSIAIREGRFPELNQGNQTNNRVIKQ